MPPSYVKAYLKRRKNDANDAAAIRKAVNKDEHSVFAEFERSMIAERVRAGLARARSDNHRARAGS